MKNIFAHEIEARRDVARFNEQTGWIEAEARGRELLAHVATIKAMYTIIPGPREMRFVATHTPSHFASVYASNERDERTGCWAIDSNRTNVSEGTPHPARAFEVVVEQRLAEIARAS